MERDYKLTKEAYQETIWFIRRYPQFEKQHRNLIDLRSIDYDKITGSGSGYSDPVAAAVIRAERVKKKISAIDNGLLMVPEEYRKGLVDNIIKKKPYPYFADTSTWKRWKRRFVYWVYQEKEEGLQL